MGDYYITLTCLLSGKLFDHIDVYFIESKIIKNMKKIKDFMTR